MAKHQSQNNGRGTRTRPRKKRDMRKFTEKLMEDAKKLSLTKSCEVGARFAIHRLAELAPEEQIECLQWARIMSPHNHGLNVIDA